MSKEILEGKIAQFFSSKGETPQEFLNSNEDTWMPQQPQGIDPWWKIKEPTPYWQNTQVEQKRYKD